MDGGTERAEGERLEERNGKDEWEGNILEEMKENGKTGKKLSENRGKNVKEKQEVKILEERRARGKSVKAGRRYWKDVEN